MGLVLRFYHKSLFFSTKDVTQSMCRLIGLATGFSNRSLVSVCDLAIIDNAEVICAEVSDNHSA